MWTKWYNSGTVSNADCNTTSRYTVLNVLRKCPGRWVWGGGPLHTGRGVCALSHNIFRFWAQKRCVLVHSGTNNTYFWSSWRLDVLASSRLGRSPARSPGKSTPVRAPTLIIWIWLIVTVKWKNGYEKCKAFWLLWHAKVEVAQLACRKISTLVSQRIGV